MPRARTGAGGDAMHYLRLSFYDDGDVITPLAAALAGDGSGLAPMGPEASRTCAAGLAAGNAGDVLRDQVERAVVHSRPPGASPECGPDACVAPRRARGVV